MGAFLKTVNGRQVPLLPLSILHVLLNPSGAPVGSRLRIRLESGMAMSGSTDVTSMAIRQANIGGLLGLTGEEVYLVIGWDRAGFRTWAKKNVLIGCTHLVESEGGDNDY